MHLWYIVTHMSFGPFIIWLQITVHLNNLQNQQTESDTLFHRPQDWWVKMGEPFLFPSPGVQE